MTEFENQCFSLDPNILQKIQKFQCIYDGRHLEEQFMIGCISVPIAFIDTFVLLPPTETLIGALLTVN